MTYGGGAPGWYPDPSGAPGAQRFWDGQGWGPSAPAPVVAVAAPVKAEPGRLTIHYGFALLAVLSLLGTVGPAVFMWLAAGSASSSSDGTTAGDDGAAAAAGIFGFFGFGWLLWGGMWTLIWAAFAINHTLKARRA